MEKDLLKAIYTACPLEAMQEYLHTSPLYCPESVKALRSLFLPVSLYRPVFAPARPCANIIMCTAFPSFEGCLKSMSYNISHSQPVTNKFQKSSRKTG